MEDWQKNILNEIGYIAHSLSKGACGAWLPLFTNDLAIAESRKLWVLDLVPIINKWDQVQGKKCEVTTISNDNDMYGVKFMFVKL